MIFSASNPECHERISWGDDLAGINEQALAAVAEQTKRQLEGIAYLAFPWSRLHNAMVGAQHEIVGGLERTLQQLLEAAVKSDASQVITCYAGANLEWAREKIGSYQAIKTVFSCFLTIDFRGIKLQNWHPVPLLHTDFSYSSCRRDKPQLYKHLQTIWQSIRCIEPSPVQQGELVLPGNQHLWHKYFAGEQAREAAQLIAEEHCGSHCAIQFLRTLGSDPYDDAFILDSNNLKLSQTAQVPAPIDSACIRSANVDLAEDQVNQKPDILRSLIGYSLELSKSHRTPLAYRQILSRSTHLYYARSASSVAITGSPGDQRDDPISLCISEEPWWDLQTRGGQYKDTETGYFDGLFDDLPIPFYLAVNPLIMDRIRLRLELMASRSDESIHQQLLRAKTPYLGIHAYRLRQDQVGYVDPGLASAQQVLPLSGLRTKIAIHARSRGLGLTYGKGWGVRGFKGFRRDAFTDWHLDKLVLIRSKEPLLGMAVENVHHCSYITEKPFDMLCSTIVPIVYASPSHVLHRYLKPKSCLNIYGLGLREVLDSIEHYSPNIAVASAMRQTASELAELFACSDIVNATLELVAERIDRWVLMQLQSRPHVADRYKS